MEDKIKYLKTKVRDIVDFPKKGILFRDITTLIKDAKALEMAADLLYEQYWDKGITKVVGIESRGFILGSILAYKLGAGLVLVRKKGKLPSVTLSKTYQLEYGSDAIEIHKDSLDAKDKVLLHDDLFATGGTTLAALDLLASAGIHKPEICFLMELCDLKGREKMPSDLSVFSLLKY